MPKLAAQKALDVLSTWTALEVLTPKSFRKAEDLLEMGQALIIPSKDQGLPWEFNGEQPPKGKKFFYQIVVGTINLEKFSSSLLEKYRDANPERKDFKGEAIVAVISVDQDGMVAADKISVAVSSFAWGLSKALEGKLKDLGDWSKIESSLLEKFDDFLRRTSQSGRKIPVSKALIAEAYEYLIDVLELPRELTNEKFFLIKSVEADDKKESAKSIILNSFYLKYLAKAADLFVEKKITKISPKQRNQNSALNSWSNSRNEKTFSLSNFFSLSVTFLKSFFCKILQKIFPQKCRQAATVNDLKHIPKNLKLYLGLESPAKKLNILSDNSVLKKAVSPKLIPPACWPASGHHPLVLLQQAAVNLSLSELEDGGILAVNGPPGTGKTTLLRDIIAGIITKRAQAMCAFNNPSEAFLETGQEVKAGSGSFRLSKLDERLKGFEILIASSNNKAVENVSVELPNLKAIAEDEKDLRYFSALSNKLLACESWGMIAAVLGNSTNCYKFSQAFWWDKDCSLNTYLLQASGTPQVLEAKDKSGKIIECVPQIIAENFPPRSEEEALNNWREARKNFQNLSKKIEEKFSELREAEEFFEYLDSLERDQNQESRATFLSRLLAFFKNRNVKILAKNNLLKAEEYRKKFGSHIIDQKLFRQDRSTLQMTLPWCDQETQLLREKLFTAAIKLHKCFIDASAKPLRHNLGIFMQQLSGAQSDSVAKSFAADLWSSFFLTVPCVSTTFASVGRMLQNLPQERLGWLLIDEAGQATPQAAVGAIMKAKRAIVVGDPMQIEPVVTLPKSLTEGICQQFEIDANRFNAPTASVQTLCDLATSYFAEFHGKYGSRQVGVPLLVHRRCEDPMFSISNVIAYERLMVKAKKSGDSFIKKCLGSSTWFDIDSDSEEKWSEKEGEKLIEVLMRIDAAPDLYIVTPFVSVAQNIRKIVKESGVLQRWKISDPKDQNSWIRDRIGTVHTVQGREAEAVIFVLGAPSKNQNGTRNWAGARPNLLNVAVTRAKEVFYVIGNKKLWREAGVFADLAERI